MEAINQKSAAVKIAKSTTAAIATKSSSEANARFIIKVATTSATFLACVHFCVCKLRVLSHFGLVCIKIVYKQF